MANPEHLVILKQGVDAWNAWRKQHPGNEPNLRKARLVGKNLENINFNDTNLRRSDLRKTNLSGASFRRTDLRRAKLSEATIRHADFTSAILVDTDFQKAVITDCLVYGISAWNIKLEGAEQKNLIISRKNSPLLTVDHLEVAQFIYLLIKNQKIRDVIDTLGKKAVLLLGRFYPQERKALLDSIADSLRQFGFLPIIFDFEGSKNRDFTETIQILAGLSLFVIVDITNPKSAPLELQATVPDYQIPFVPIIQKGEKPFSMLVNLQSKYDWVLDTLEYETEDQLLAVLRDAVINPAIEKHNQLQRLKTQKPQIRSASDFLKSGGED
jgi:uncharacterized protein YjbI with pentapeptide repeats